jgi:hypothetical protein
MNQPLHDRVSFSDIKHFKLRIAVVIIASGLIVVKWHDPLLPAFIAISQIMLLVLDYRKLKARRLQTHG